MTNEELIYEKVLEAFRLLAETFPLFSPPPPMIPQLTLYVNGEESPRTVTPARGFSELKKSYRGGGRGGRFEAQGAVITEN